MNYRARRTYLAAAIPWMYAYECALQLREISSCQTSYYTPLRHTHPRERCCKRQTFFSSLSRFPLFPSHQHFFFFCLVVIRGSFFFYCWKGSWIWQVAIVKFSFYVSPAAGVGCSTRAPPDFYYCCSLARYLSSLVELWATLPTFIFVCPVLPPFLRFSRISSIGIVSCVTFWKKKTNK